MATARRSKRSLKDKPKHRQALSLKTRRRKAKMKAAQKRGLNRAKVRRQNRSNKLSVR